MGFELDNTWVGLGMKVGGITIFGAETFWGAACRLDEPAKSWRGINVTSIRLGLGLGGSAGTSAFFGFNVPTLWQVNGMSMTDWGINIAIPEVKIGISKLSYHLKFMKNLAPASKALFKTKIVGSVTPETIQKLREVASLLFNSMTEGADGITSSEPTPVVIDVPVPGMGWGAELSAYLSSGEFSVDGKIG